MSNVICFEACSTLRCSLSRTHNTIHIVGSDANKFSLPLNSHVYFIIEADGVREEVRFNGGPTFGGNLTIERGENRQTFPVGASVCVGITCGYLEDFVCQRVKECGSEASVGSGELLPRTNQWTGANTFIRPVSFGDATWDQELVSATRLLSVSSGLWVNYRTALDEDQYGYLSTVTRTVGDKRTYGSKVTARGEAGVTGGISGISSEAWAAPGAAVSLTGGQSVVYSQESNTIEAKVGHTAIFRNRPDGVSATVSGLGANKYNQNSTAYAVEAQARSSAGEYCGWSRGLVFGAGSLDETAGAKAVGIDFSDVSTTEVARVDSWIRMKYDVGIEWNGDSLTYDKLKSAFNRTAGQWGFTWKSNSRFGFRVDNGTLLFADTGATTPLLVTTAGAASGQFLPVEVNGTVYKIELRLA